MAAVLVTEYPVVFADLWQRDNIEDANSHLRVSAGTPVDNYITLVKDLLDFLHVPCESHLVTEPDCYRKCICIVRTRGSFRNEFVCFLGYVPRIRCLEPLQVF